MTAALTTPLLALPSGCSRAHADGKIQLRVGSAAVGGVLEGFVSDWFTLELDPQLGAMELGHPDGTETLATNLLLKGEGAARDRALDDARNAAPVAALARDVLGARYPDLKAALAAAHKTWARAFARKVLAWTQGLRASPLHGKAVRDEYGRIYVLEWAGAKIDPTGMAAPAGLGQLAAAPLELSAVAYSQYIEELVALLVRG